MMKGSYNIAAMLLAVCALIMPKAQANTFSHLAPADTVYYVEGSLSELETAMGYESTDLLIQIHKLGLSEVGKIERQEEPSFALAYDIGVNLANYLHETYAQLPSNTWNDDRYALYLDGVFPVLHLSTAKAQAIHASILNEAQKNSLPIRTETWDEKDIWYLTLHPDPAKDLGLIELAMVLSGDELTLSVTSNEMPLMRKMKVLGLVSDFKSLADDDSKFSRLVQASSDQGSTGFLNTVNLGRMLVANPTTTAGVDLNLYFPELAKDLVFKENKRECAQELDELANIAPFIVTSTHVNNGADGVELQSDFYINIESAILAEHLYSLNGPLRLNDDAAPMLLDISAAFNFTDAARKLMELQNYFESYTGTCPEIRSLYADIIGEGNFAQMALGASFVEGINGLNLGVKELEINTQNPEQSNVEAYASISTMNLSIIESAAKLIPEEYNFSIPEAGTAEPVYLPGMPPHLNLIMQASETELTARIGRDTEELAQPMVYQQQPGILAVDVDLAAFKSMYSQIPMGDTDCHSLQRGAYMIERLADRYDFVFSAQEWGLHFNNNLLLPQPISSFSTPLEKGKYQFQYSDDNCEWNTFDVVNITDKKPYNVELGQVLDSCSEVSAVMDFAIKQGVLLVTSKGSYRANCESVKEDYEYDFDCVIESHNGTELICTEPESDSLYRLVKMDLQEIAAHKKAIDGLDNLIDKINE